MLYHTGFFHLVTIDWSCRRQPEAHLIILKMFSLLQLDLVLPVNKVHLDLMSLLTTLAQNAVVMETRGLTRCLLSETTTKIGQKETVLNTEGINVHELLQHSDVRSWSNMWVTPALNISHRHLTFEQDCHHPSS